jgi:hypothetical protein
MKPPPDALLGWLHHRDVLVRRFVLAEVLGPPRAAAWARPGGTRVPGAAPAGEAERRDPARESVSRPK